MTNLDLSIQKTFDPVSKTWENQIFIRFYVAARTTGFLASIGAENLQTFLAIATFMDADGRSFPTEVQIAQALGVSRRQVIRRLQKLLEFRWQGQPLVEVVRVRTPGGQWDNLRYTILPTAPVGFGPAHHTAPPKAHPDHVPHVSHGEDQVTSMPCDTDVTLTRTSGFVGSMSSSSGSLSLQSPTVSPRGRAREAGESQGTEPPPPVSAALPAGSDHPDWQASLEAVYGARATDAALACLEAARASGRVIRSEKAFVRAAIAQGWTPSAQPIAPTGRREALSSRWAKEDARRAEAQADEARVMGWLSDQPPAFQAELRRRAEARVRADMHGLFGDSLPEPLVEGYLYRLAKEALECGVPSAASETPSALPPASGHPFEAPRPRRRRAWSRAESAALDMARDRGAPPARVG